MKRRSRAQLVMGTRSALSPPWTDVPPALGVLWREAPRARASAAFVDTKRADHMEFNLQAPGALPHLVPSSSLSLSLYFFPLQISEAVLLATEKTTLNYSPSSKGGRACSRGCSVKLSERPFSSCRNNPVPPAAGLPATAPPSVFAAWAELFPCRLSVCLPDSRTQRAAWLGAGCLSAAWN